MPSIEIWHYILLAGLGIIAGTLNVLAGGGSLLTLPTMIFLGMDGPAANGTNRVAILAQNLTAVSTFRSKGYSDFRLSLSLALATVPGAIAGAWLGTLVRGETFNRVLGVILIGVLIHMAIEHIRKGKKKTTPPAPANATPLSRKRYWLGHLCLVGVGFYGGFIQAGVGFLLMAALHQVMGLDLVRVNMHKVFIIGVFTLIALIVFASRGQVLWVPGLGLALGNSIGGWIGSHISVSKGESWIRGALCIALLVMAVKLLF